MSPPRRLWDVGASSWNRRRILTVFEWCWWIYAIYNRTSATSTRRLTWASHRRRNSTSIRGRISTSNVDVFRMVPTTSVLRREIDVEVRRLWWSLWIMRYSRTSTRRLRDVEFRRRMSTNSGLSHRRRSFVGLLRWPSEPVKYLMLVCRLCAEKVYWEWIKRSRRFQD